MITGRKMSRCECGKVKARDSRRCLTCHNTAIAGFKAAAQKVIDTGRCPICGGKLVRNLALSGWWQCENYGRPDNLKCGFQAFGEG